VRMRKTVVYYDVTRGGGFPRFRRQVAPRLIIDFNNIMQKSSKIYSRGWRLVRAVIRAASKQTGFYALRIRMYALRNSLRDFTVFYGGVNDLRIIILYAAKIEGWAVGFYSVVVSIPASKPQGA
jgi:hypothetical protein